jgi:hypothetical protein
MKTLGEKQMAERAEIPNLQMNIMYVGPDSKNEFEAFTAMPIM